jgi:hypothetical protein
MKESTSEADRLMAQINREDDLFERRLGIFLTINIAAAVAAGVEPTARGGQDLNSSQSSSMVCGFSAPFTREECGGFSCGNIRKLNIMQSSSPSPKKLLGVGQDCDQSSFSGSTCHLYSLRYG